jgi:hypothetical protein
MHIFLSSFLVLLYEISVALSSVLVILSTYHDKMRAGKACVVKGKWGKERGKTKISWLSDGFGDVDYAMEKASGSCIAL